MNSKKLKPCPFCGGGARLIKYACCKYVKCDSCHADLACGSSAENNINAWNSRPVETRQRRDLLKQKHALMREVSELKSLTNELYQCLDDLYCYDTSASIKIQNNASSALARARKELKND